MKEVLDQYCRYNHWANSKLLNFLEGLPEDILINDIHSSFRSIRKTALHIWDAEVIWLLRLKGQPIKTWPSEQLPENESINGLLETSGEWKSFVFSKDSSFFLGSCYYKSISGEEHSNVIHAIIMHCMNHSTFHRGQIITALRALGLKEKLPQTDLIAFERVKTLKA
jgi:uncharacterized damage-inducible protein DinB